MKDRDKGKVKVLVTAIGGPTGYGVLKCLESKQDIYIVGVDADKNCHAAAKCNRFCVVPRISSADFKDKIKKLIERFDIDVVIPTLQDELSFFNELKKQVKVITPHNINNLLDKIKIYELMKKNKLKILVPKYSLVSNISDYKKVLKEFGYPEKKVCIKPASGHGGLGFKIIANPEEVAKKIFKQQLSNMMTSDELERLLSISFEEPLILMEYLPGDEYSVDLLAKESKLLVAVPRKRDRVSNGIVIRGKVEKNEQLIQATKSIVELLNLDSFINLQFRFDEQGNAKLIDLNPRFCGSQIMSLGAGINFPYMCIKIAMGENLEPVVPKWNTAMTRYWESYFYEIQS